MKREAKMFYKAFQAIGFILIFSGIAGMLVSYNHIQDTLNILNWSMTFFFGLVNVLGTALLLDAKEQLNNLK
jgi:hypothetical protein